MTLKFVRLAEPTEFVLGQCGMYDLLGKVSASVGGHSLNNHARRYHELRA